MQPVGATAAYCEARRKIVRKGSSREKSHCDEVSGFNKNSRFYEESVELICEKLQNDVPIITWSVRIPFEVPEFYCIHGLRTFAFSHSPQFLEPQNLKEDLHLDHPKVRSLFGGGGLLLTRYYYRLSTGGALTSHIPISEAMPNTNITAITVSISISNQQPRVSAISLC